jgi:hypothetical protein
MGQRLPIHLCENKLGMELYALIEAEALSALLMALAKLSGFFWRRWPGGI